MRTAKTTWLLTGVTGFLGKVLLEELMRRRAELGIARVLVLIRPRGTLSGSERFRRDVVGAACFATLPVNWTECVTVLDGDLSLPGLGLPDSRVLAELTHVAHCAASIEFDLPAREAAAANIDATMHLLEAVRPLQRLQRFVYVSTAYVTPHPADGAAIPEALVPLPAPAEELYDAIHSGRFSDESILARTGHPNTYTLTKCLAEHLVVARCGAIPLSIVRPSIISASRQFPFPGWIDSTAGLGAFVVLAGMGHLRAIVGDTKAQLDVVPVDEVTARIVRAAMQDRGALQIRHAVAGLAGAEMVGACWSEITDWFGLHPVARRPKQGFMGPSSLRFRVAELWHHRLPLAIGGMRSAVERSKVKKLQSRLEHLNRVFPYFTTRSFDFRSSFPLAPSRLGAPYIRTICRGLYRHVLRRDENEWTLAGAEHAGHGGDLTWAVGQPRGNAWIRAAAWVVTKMLRRTTERVTVDLGSFNAARARIPESAALVLVPSHRSYLDFVLCSYLAFARPDLGIPIPHIAATMEFGRIPLLGRLLRSMHAFYLRRGEGREDPALTARVRELIGRGETLEFFVEGARSRTREFLAPKRGLLRCLQSTGRTVALVPIAISYDRRPEEAAFAHERSGGAKTPMRIGTLIGWAISAWRGRISLGRVHVAAGSPVILNTTSDVPTIATAVIDELRRAMPITTFHLKAYTAHHPIAGHDADSLRRLIEAQGGRVLQSALEPDGPTDAMMSGTLRAQFEEWCGPVFAQRERLPAPGLRARVPA